MERQKAKSFTNLSVWQKAHGLVLFIYKITKQFPSEEKFGLTAQFRDAGISIAANIAEGFKRRHKKDKLHFYNIAQGSLEECRYYFILSKDLAYINNLTFQEGMDILEIASRLLNSYCEGLIENYKPL